MLKLCGMMAKTIRQYCKSCFIAHLIKIVDNTNMHEGPESDIA